MTARFNKFSTSIFKRKTRVDVAENEIFDTVGGKPIPSAKNCVEQFLNELTSLSVSQSTLRNYSSDILQFIEFSNDNDIRTVLSGKNFQAFFAEQQHKGLKSSSIQRKIVSLKLFSQWAEKNILSAQMNNQVEAAPVQYVQPEQPEIKETVQPISNNLENTIEAPTPDLEVDENLQNVEQFANSESVTPSKNSSENKKGYQGWILGPYFHLATLVIFFIFISILWYRQFFVTVPQDLAYPSAPVTPERILSFQARLTDAAGSPITTATNTTFRLYNDATAGSLLWNSGTCSIDPDQDGIFSTILGSTCGSAIDSSVFTENSQVWLEITVVSDTLTPRQRIATVPYALNSETIQGFPINSTQSATRNTVLVMNQWGEVLLGEQSPDLRSVSGTFTVSGSTLNLSTNAGSGGDITLSPDGNNVIFSDNTVLNIGGAAATAYNFLADSTAGNTTAVGDNDLYIQDILEVDGAVKLDSSVTLSTLNTAGGIVYTNGSGQLLVSSAGTGGDCLLSGGTGSPTWGTCGSGGLSGTWRIVNGAHSPVNDTLDLLVGSNASSSAKFAVLNVNSGTPTASLSAGATGGTFLTATGSLQTTDSQTLTLGGSTTGDIALSPLNGSGNVLANIGASQLLNVLTGNLKVGNATPTVTLNGEDAFVEGSFEVDGQVRFDNSTITFSSYTTDGGLIYTNGSGVISQTAQGSAGQCLKSNAGGAPTFGTCASDNYWRLANGALSPVNDTLDLLIGNTATISAKFAVLNVNSGTPTATLSAGAAGGAFLSADGVLQTTANQTLTLGGSTTGDIAFSPLNSTGGVNFNLGVTRLLNVLTGNLKVGNGTPDVTQNGEDAYIEGTLEVDGAARFDSSLTITTLNNAGGVIYANGSGQLLVSSAGSSGDCLQSGGTGAPTWSTCGSGGLAGTWRIGNGAHSPVNDTLDLLVGSAATSSAKFAVINVNSGTPTATLSAGAAGGSYLTADGILQTTASQTLTLGGSTTGDIAISPLNSTGGVNVNLGAARLFNILAGNLKIGNGTPTVTQDGEDAYVEGTFEVDGAVRFDNSSVTLSSFTTDGGLLYTNGSGVLAQTAQGSAGECLKSNAGGAPTFGLCAAGDLWRLNAGTISPANDTLDLLVGSNATTSAKFAVINVNSGTPTATLSAGAAGGSYLTATGALQTTANQTLTLGGSTTGDIAISPLNSTGGVNVNVGATRLLNVLTGNLKVGNAAPTVAQDGEDAYIEGTFEVDGTVRFDNSSITLSSFTSNGGILYTNGSGSLSQVTAGTSTQCLFGGTTPTFGTCLQGDLWRLNAGTISPSNDTLDLLVGSNATTSAKFAVLNVNSGTPVATLSAGAAGGSYLTADGTLQSTANQTLTLGGSTTGDISISPLNSAGGVNVNLGAARLLNVLTGNLKVGNAAPSVAQDGEDAFVEGTFEVDGAVRLDNSSITLSSFTTNGGLLYTNGSGVVASTAVGNSGECLTSVGGGTPVWASCSAAAGGNFWRISSGAISSINDTIDFLVGSNATSSAKFAVINVNSGTPTASLSAGAAGGSYLTAAGALQTTANQTLTLGGSTTGDIDISPLNSAGGVNVNLGAARLMNILTGNLKVGNAAPSVAQDGEDAYVEGTFEVDGAVRFDNSSITLSSFTTNGGLLYTNGSGVVASTAAGNSGECLTSNGGGAPTWTSCSASSGNFWRVSSGAISPVNDTLDFLIGNTATISAKFAVLNVNSGTPTASLSAGAAGGSFLSATGSLQTTANQTLTLGGSTTGDIALSPLNSAGGVNVNLGAARLLNVLTGNLKVGNATPTVSQDGEDGFIEGTFEVDGAVRFDNSSITLSSFTTNGGLLYTNGSGVVASTAAGNSGECLTSIGGGTPVWANCSAASSNYWRVASGAISPVNDTLDLLIGNTATISAKFAVLNVNSGTPTASLSAGAAGGSFLTATGALQTTANQTLTLGGSTTGDIAISPLNSAGGVNVNLGAARLMNILTGNLKVGNASPTVSQDGEDAFIEGTFEVDGAVRFDNSAITLSSFTANGGLLYTNGSGVLAQTAVGSSGECLTSIGGGTPAWANCSAASGNLWRLASGAISPVNNTLDLLVGSNATSSAKFAVLNVNSGTPTASLSAGATGGSYLSAAGALQTTANQTLAIGGSTTGDITMLPLNGQGGVTVTSSLATAARSTDLMTLTQANDGTRDSTAQLLQLTNLDTASTASLLDIAQSGVGGTGLSITTDGTGTAINLTGQAISTGNGISFLASAITSGNGISMVSNTSSASLSNFSGKAINVTLGRTYTGGSTVTDSGNFVALARTNAQNTGAGTFAITGDLATLSSTCSASGGTCTDSSNILSLAQNYASATGSVFDVTNAGTGIGIQLTSSSTGDLMTLDASGAGTTPNGLSIRQTGAGTITDAIDLSDETITNALNLGSNTITGAGYLMTSTASGLTINSTSADLALTTTTSGSITATPGTASLLFNVLTGNLKVGNGAPSVTQDGEDAYVEGTFEVDGAVRFDNSSLTLSSFTTNGGLLYTNGSGVVSSTAAGNSGECLKSNGGGAPTFQSCGGAGSNWRITNGALSPINDTLDFLIGNTATTSAKFAVLNVNSGTPTASLSAGAAGGSYLSAAGTLQTTAAQLLTIGGSTTGDITLSPKNGAGTLTFNEDLLTTGTGLNLTADTLTSGTAFLGQSTSTALTTGKLLSFDWSPTGSTEIYAGSGSALLNLNIGTYGNIDKILNIQDDGSTLFSVSQGQITSALPHEFTAAGDVSIAYDIQFTNQTASYIKSNAPLQIEAGESFENNNLTLKTYGTGKIITDGGFSINSQETLTDSTTPDVGGASHFVEANGTNRLVTNFTNGTAGQIIVIEQTTANLDFDCTTNTNFNCGNADITGAAGAVFTWISDGTQWNMISYMNAGTAGGNDLAEFFPSSESLEAGDVIGVDTSYPVTIKKETEKASESVIGIISTQPGITLGDDLPGSYKVALAGRVPVKVDPNSPQIHAGDHVTSSDLDGTAQLAEEAGITIGVALEDWIPGSGDNDVMVFVNRTWYEPSALKLTLNTDGSLASNYTVQTPAQSQNGRFSVISNATNQVIQELSVLAQLVVGEIQAGLIRSQQIIADSITVNQKLTSPEIETDSLKTSLISPLSNGDLTFKLGNDADSDLTVKNASDEAVFNIDQEGNTDIAGNLNVAQDATVAGELSANSGRFEQLLAQKATLENTEIQTATITGQLYLADGRSIQSIIEDNDDYLASISAQAEQITQQIQSAPQALSSSSFADFLSQLTGSEDASVSAAISALAQQQNITLQSTDMVLAPDAIFVKEYLNVAGFAQFNNANVSSSLTIGNNMILTQDSIASLNQTLFIQPTATSSVNIMAGLLVLNPDGNVELNGNLIVSGDVKIGQKLNTNSIQPNDYSSDFTLKLATQSAVLGADTQSKFSILDASNSAVASIDASGSARFNELSAQGLVIQNPIATATDSATLTENQKYQTIGSNTLPAGATEFTIENYNVNENVLINLTPTSDTANQVLFVKTKETCSGPIPFASCKKSFTVGIKNAVTQDISFNYWIVKVQ